MGPELGCCWFWAMLLAQGLGASGLTLSHCLGIMPFRRMSSICGSGLGASLCA